MSGKYDDIIHLPHHVSGTHPQMPLADRAAQFSPFAALTGYEAAIRETERLTTAKVELDEEAKAALDEKLRLLAEVLEEHPVVSITYFQPDERKAGGAYLTAIGVIKKIDEYEHIVVMLSGEQIPIDNIIEIDSEVFRGLY